MTSAPSAGRLLVNRYALTEVIGNGPASVVWKAWDEELGSDVAVKEIQLRRGLDDLESAVVLKRVLREGREAASFRHPGAVVVHDVFEESGGVFVVMELFTGPTLGERVTERGPLPAEAAAGLAAQLLDTLEAAHAAGILHRAVSPGNVVWSDDGPALLSDFAVSGSLIPGRDPSLSPYCAPEQTPTTGASPAADLWSLGATLRFAVEGGDRVDGKQSAGTMQPLFDALLADDPAARADVATARRLLTQAAATTEPAVEVTTPAPSAK
ncbi:MAG: serine/threonine protein kinase, partial [Actinomycetota bacterium]|nr:serine/threonine protein kinase [Actinomycetota bacterium]